MIAQDNGTSKGVCSVKYKYGQEKIIVGIKSYTMDGDIRNLVLQGEERISISKDEFPEGKWEEFHDLISQAADAKLVAIAEAEALALAEAE